MGRRLGGVPPDPTDPRPGPGGAEDGCPGAQRTVTCHADTAAPRLPSTPPHPETPRGAPPGRPTSRQHARADPGGWVSGKAAVPAARSPSRYWALLREQEVIRGRPAHGGATGHAQCSSPGAALSPGFRRSSERRREVGPGRTRRLGSPEDCTGNSPASVLPGAPRFRKRQTSDFFREGGSIRVRALSRGVRGPSILNHQS